MTITYPPTGRAYTVQTEPELLSLLAAFRQLEAMLVAPAWRRWLRCA